jgi:hypothetical protein
LARDVRNTYALVFGAPVFSLHLLGWMARRAAAIVAPSKRNSASGQPEPHPTMPTTQVLLKGCHEGRLLLPRPAWEALAAAFAKPFPKVAEVGSQPFPVGAALGMFAFLQDGWERLRRGEVCWVTPLAAAWPEVLTEARLGELCHFLRRCGGFAVLDHDDEGWPRPFSTN